MPSRGKGRRSERTRGFAAAKPQLPDEDSRTVEYGPVLAHAVDTFGTWERAKAWLNRPNRVFGNQTALQVLTQDPSAVEEELVRIDHGMLS